MTITTDSAERKNLPLARGVLDYFPDALLAVADLSQKGNDKHNPGEDLHWARGKSMDHADCILRHLIERGSIDTDGISHSVKVAWRALALLQEELEKGLPRGARVSEGADAPEWTCPGCGSHEVWGVTQYASVLRETGAPPQCNTDGCFVRMVGAWRE